MKRNNFGKGKTRLGDTNVFKDNKTGKRYIWSKGKWALCKADKEVDEILSYLELDDK